MFDGVRRLRGGQRGVCVIGHLVFLLPLLEHFLYLTNTHTDTHLSLDTNHYHTTNYYYCNTALGCTVIFMS